MQRLKRNLITNPDPPSKVACGACWCNYSTAPEGTVISGRISVQGTFGLAAEYEVHHIYLSRLC